MSRNRKKLWQARCVALYQNVGVWQRHAKHYHNELTEASFAVLEYEKAMGAYLDEVEAERDWYREAWEYALAQE